MLLATPGPEPLLYCSPVCHSSIKGCGGVINAECGSREQPAGCLRPAGLLESASLSRGPGRVRWSQCSQLMHSKEVQEGHNEKWAVVQRAKKRLCYSTPSPGCAVAPSAAVAVSVLGTGPPFPWHPPVLMLPGQGGALCVVLVPKGAGRQGSCSQGSKAKASPHPCAGRPLNQGEVLSCFHQDDAVLH